eukprot:CAMPEP_0197192854 /NCGR_PEP_ID=MMETSP1423-20130617/25874_1 /TAXON_ID=476441 /ORGANISM="Pseudo-nitzschia heimii, Strain UNC1101" /LENGTH=677 /DNA_ID=CAMNT_0042645843 /DNA_START=117 /DNA_END=2150 /DNA_ORIENTATION=+
MDSLSTDEYSALGGSLMKQLLANLEVDDNDWEIEELEKELDNYQNQISSIVEQQPLPALNAASIVVSHSQQRSSSILPALQSSQGTNVAPLPPPGMPGNSHSNMSTTDAWSLSLQKFTSLSLQEDFLAADSARKQTSTRPSVGMAALAGAEDYDIREKPTIGPPPGMGGVGIATEPNPKLPFPPAINNNSKSPSTVEMKDPGAIAGLEPSLPRKLDPSQNNFPTATTTFPVSNSFLTPPPNMMPLQGTMMPPPQIQRGIGLPPPAPPGMLMPPAAIRGPVNQNQPPPPPMGVPMPIPMATPITTPLTGVVVGAAVSNPGPAWQNPRPVVPPPPPAFQSKAYCNPYPGVPPIPATALASSCMSGRDIAYVVHAILKPVLAQGISENDYYIQYIKRRIGGQQADPVNPKRSKDATYDVASRATKSKEWASEKSVLGHVTKSNVARPRALIATPNASADQDNKEQRQRANLWKARVYCDQAYQAYQKVVDSWRAAPSKSGVPPQVQQHLLKLKKCMGIVLDKEKKAYVISDEALKLIAKLEKGRTLISRVLEEALLPPSAVQALLPALLDIVIGLPLGSGDSTKNALGAAGVEEKTVGRLFQAIAGIIQKLNISGKTLVECLEVALRHGKSATNSIVRTGCLHLLLQKGQQVVPKDPSEEVREAWGIAERKLAAGFKQGP